jgi:hypothetical protein
MNKFKELQKSTHSEMIDCNILKNINDMANENRPKKYRYLWYHPQTIASVAVIISLFFFLIPKAEVVTFSDEEMFNELYSDLDFLNESIDSHLTLEKDDEEFNTINSEIDLMLESL